MIKSLPIENILPKVSLSSKKSVESGDTGFVNILHKASVNVSKHADSQAVSGKPKDIDKKDAKTKSKNRNDTDKVEYAGVRAHSIQSDKAKNADAKDKHQANDEISKSKTEKGNIKNSSRNVQTKEIVVKHIQIKDKKIANLEQKQNEKTKNADKKKKSGLLVKTKNSTVEEQENGLVKSTQIKNKNLHSEKIRINNYIQHEKNEQMSKVEIKKRTENKVNVSSQSEIKNADNKKEMPKNDIKKVTIKDIQFSDIRKLHSKDGKKDMIAYTNKTQKEKTMQTENKSKITDNLKNTDISEKSVSISEINEKYAKKLNINNIEVSNNGSPSKSRKSKEIKITTDAKQSEGNISVDDKISTIKLKSVDIFSKKEDLRNSQESKKTKNKAENKVQITTKVVKEADKSIKIKTIKNAKGNKVIKIDVSQVENYKKKEAKTDIKTDHVHKEQENSIDNVSMKNTVKIIEAKKNQTLTNFAIKPKLKDAPDDLDKKTDRVKNIKKDVLLSQQISTHIRMQDAPGTDSINRLYPMDKIIENIDKIMNMKPPFNNTVTIKLNPPHIGVLELQVKMDRDKNISAVITADDKNVLKVVNSHIDGLKNYLNSQGIKVAHIDVHNGFHEQANFGGSQNQGMLGNGQQQNAGSRGFNDFNSTFLNRESINFKDSDDYKKGHPIKGVDITV